MTERLVYTSTSKHRVVPEEAPLKARLLCVPSNALEAYDYQVQAVRTFTPSLGHEEKLNCRLVSPTGSGKSLIIMTMALLWIERQKKVVLVVPQNSIKNGFKSKNFGLDGRQYQWVAPVNLQDTKEDQVADSDGQVQGLLEFLEDDNLLDAPHRRVWICTYGTLLAARGSNDPRFNLSQAFLVLDEAHHLATEKGANCAVVEASNEGGKLLNQLYEENVPHMLCTASPYRADGRRIVPEHAEHRYCTFTRQRADHIADMQFVEAFSTRVIIGQVMEVLERELTEAKRLGLKSLISLPHVSSNHAQRFAKQLGLDPAASDNKLQFETRIKAACQRLGMSCFSVVDAKQFEDNDPKLRDLFSRLSSAGSSEKDLDAIPDVVLVQERYKEGTDCVAWSRCIQIGLSESCVALSQFPGRVMRDHWSKKGHTVEFITLLPDFDSVEGEDKFVWTMDVIKSLLILGFMDQESLDRFKPIRVIKDPQINGETEPTRSEMPPTPAEVAQSFEATFVTGSSTSEQVRILDTLRTNFVGTGAAINNLGEVSYGPTAITANVERPVGALKLEPLSPKIPVDSSCVADGDITHRLVTEWIISLGSTIGKFEARDFRNRLARNSDVVMRAAIEQMYRDEHQTIDQIAVKLQVDREVVRTHLERQRLLLGVDNIRSRKKPRRKRLSV